MQKITLVLFTLFFSRISFSQPVSDAGMWNTFSFEKQFTSKFSVVMDQELRLKENFTMLNLLYTNFGISLKPFKSFKVSLTYRLIDKWQYEVKNFSYRQRLMLDFSYKLKLRKRLALSYRARFQTEFRDLNVSPIGAVPEFFWRNKFDLKYKIGRYVPYVGVEFRYQIKDPRNPETDLGWHRVRSFLGIDYDLSDRSSVGIYYLTQRDFKINNPQYLYIVGLQYSFTLRPKEKNTEEPVQQQ